MTERKPNLYDLFVAHTERFDRHAEAVEADMRAMRSFMAAQPPKCKSMTDNVTDCQTALFDPETGVVHRVDVLETKDSTRSESRASWWAAAAVVVAVATFLWELVKKG